MRNNKQEIKALNSTDPWVVGWKRFGKKAKSRGNRRAGKAICRKFKNNLEKTHD